MPLWLLSDVSPSGHYPRLVDWISELKTMRRLARFQRSLLRLLFITPAHNSDDTGLTDDNNLGRLFTTQNVCLHRTQTRDRIDEETQPHSKAFAQQTIQTTNTESGSERLFKTVPQTRFTWFF